MNPSSHELRSRLARLSARAALWPCLCVAVLILGPSSALSAEKKAAHAAPPAAASLPSSPLDNVAVKSIRESDPTKPLELIRAINNLVRLGEMPLAQAYVKRLTALTLSQKELAALGEASGMEPLLRIAGTKELGPSAAAFANKVLNGVRAAETDPKRIAKLLKELRRGSEAERSAARIDLKQAGMAAIEPLIKVLADGADKQMQVEARTLLVALGQSAVEPMLAVFDSSSPEVKAQVAAVLYHLADARSLDTLLAASVAPNSPPPVAQLAAAAVQQTLGRVATRQEVASLLEQRVADYLHGQRPWPSDPNGVSQMWQWDAKRDELTQKSMPQSEAAMIYAAYLARLLTEVAPDSRRAAQLRLLADLQLTKSREGLDRPLLKGRAAYDRAAENLPLLEASLRQAMTDNYIPAAIAAAQLLGDSGQAELLAHGGAAPSTLVQAAEHPDTRLRFAALQAIARLKPAQPFSGASVVTRSLAHFANVSGHARAVVADPRPDRAHQLGALLGQAGLATDVATDGRDMFLAAVASPEVELALINITVEHPAADELIRQLRRDPRTARLPIGLLANPEDLYRAEGIALKDPLVMAFVRPRDFKTMQERVASLRALPGADYVPNAERQAQAAGALAILADLASKPQPLFDLSGQDAAVEPALIVPNLAPAAITALGKLGTPRSQRTLANLASTGTQPIALRRAAAAALADSLQRHGIRLSIVEIQEQSRRYEASASQDQETQDVLWSVLDGLQKVKKKKPPAPKKEAAVRK